MTGVQTCALPIWYEFSELDQIEHSYSITIHKSQGSEFDVVIMCLPQAAPMLLTRNLLYTGITRAKELLIVLGANNVVNFMIQNTETKKRNTGLESKLVKWFIEICNNIIKLRGEGFAGVELEVLTRFYGNSSILYWKGAIKDR